MPLLAAARFTMAKAGCSPGVLRWMNGWAEVACAHHGALFSLKKGGDSETGCRMGAP